MSSSELDCNLSETSSELDSNLNETILHEENGNLKWKNRKQYYLSSIGYTVGIGNMWRFPWQLKKNGGG